MQKARESRRVYFGLDESDNKNSIVIRKGLQNNIVASVGFLKEWHRYRIEVFIPRELVDLSAEQPLLPSNGAGDEFSCILESLSSMHTGSLLVLNVLAKGRELNEVLFMGNGSQSTQIVISGTVLGSDMGTPLLKDGVHLIGKEKEQFSDDD